MSSTRNVLITGAGGFIGSKLVSRLLIDPRFSESSIVLVDLRLPAHDDPRVTRIEGDLTEPDVLDRALRATPSLVFHLAGILGGAAEADYSLSRRVNIDGTLALLERLRETDSVPRVVFASSIAVFGPPLPELVDDDVQPRPLMTYGAQKLMIEVVIEQFSARGWIDGVAIRLPGIVARRDADSRQRAAFLNLVFFAAEEGSAFVLPVSEEGTSWLISVPACIDAFVHAGVLPSGDLGRRRAFTLPAQRVRIGDLVDRLGEIYPASQGRITYEPDEELEALFASHPELHAPEAESLGFRHDGDLDTLISRAIDG